MENKWKNTAFWSWNEKIEKEEAILQLADFKEKGYGGVFIHARGGLEIEYMGEEWFSVFDACVQWADRNGFDIWIYDEFGWPSGFGGGKVNGLSREYQVKSVVSSPSLIMDESHELLDTYKGEEGVLYLYSVADKNYVDLLNPQVTQAFIESTHEIYYKRYKKYFGNVIKGVFTDEPQICIRPYSPYLENAFFENYGKCLKENLWRLFIPNAQQKKFFYQYYSTIAKLFTESFTQPLAKWCQDKGVALTGHFAGEDGLIGQYRASGGVAANYAWMQQPGIDFLGRRIAPVVLTKQLSSVKNQLEKDVIMSETLGCCGWNVSFAQLAWIWGYQAAFGINKACLHLSAYTIRGIRKRDYPAFFSYQEPWWECFGALADEMATMNEFVSMGKEKNDILVLNPITSVYQGYDDRSGWMLSAAFRETLEGLLNKQYAFDLGDERILAKYGKVKEGKLYVGAGEYSFVIVPQSITWERATFELLQRFKEAGGKVLFVNERPVLCEYNEIPKEYEDLLSAPVIANRASFFEKYFLGVGYTRKAVVTDIGDGQVCSGLVLRVTQDENKMYIFIQNISCGHIVDGVLKISDFGRICEKTRPLFYSRGMKGVSARIKIPPMGNMQITLDKTLPPIAGKERYLGERVLPIYSTRLTAENALTIDKAYYEINGKRSKPIDTAIIQEEINRAVNALEEKEAKVIVGYYFTTQAHFPCLKLAVEIKGAKKVYCNGTEVTKRFKGWFLDKCIRVADISDLQKIGKNQVTVEYEVVGEKSLEAASVGYETEKNIFFHKVEAESIYILGDFAVEGKAEVFDDGFLTVDGEEFALCELKALDFSEELTQQGMFFYRGGVEYRCAVTKEQNERICLRFKNANFATAKLTCNAGEKIVINPLAETDITSLLKNGENELRITVYGSNRNLLGPFHHKSGDPAVVGGTAFYGRKGIEDILYDHLGTDVYDEKYHFVKFALGDTILIKYLQT